MKIRLIQKSLSDPDRPVSHIECETSALTVRDFISESVSANYARKPARESLAECITLAEDNFVGSGFYIVNTTANHRYTALDEPLSASENDELAIIKLKYVRGMIW